TREAHPADASTVHVNRSSIRTNTARKATAWLIRCCTIWHRPISRAWLPLLCQAALETQESSKRGIAPFAVRSDTAESVRRTCHFFAKLRAWLKNRRKAGLSFVGSQTALNGIFAASPATERKVTSGN